MVLGRLAVDEGFQGGRIGKTLLSRTGIRAILAHAISERARSFYEDCGFIPSPVDPMTLMITVADAAKIEGLPRRRRVQP